MRCLLIAVFLFGQMVWADDPDVGSDADCIATDPSDQWEFFADVTSGPYAIQELQYQEV